MIIHELHKHKEVPHLISIDSSSRITVSHNSLNNSCIYYETLTEKDACLKIGKFCSIASKVSFFLGGNHNINRISTWLPYLDMKYDQSRDLLTKGDIIIENDVWIGRDSTILSGVKIGTGSVIGTSAVVAKDVEPYSIVVGNPAKIIKKRFDDRQIQILLKSEWWNWSIEKIKNNSHIIFGESFEEFEKLVNQSK